MVQQKVKKKRFLNCTLLQNRHSGLVCSVAKIKFGNPKLEYVLILPSLVICYYLLAWNHWSSFLCSWRAATGLALLVEPSCLTTSQGSRMVCVGIWIVSATVLQAGWFFFFPKKANCTNIQDHKKNHMFQELRSCNPVLGRFTGKICCK